VLGTSLGAEVIKINKMQKVLAYVCFHYFSLGTGTNRYIYNVPFDDKDRKEKTG
jgi:hypothetical protein